jgi:glycosyltransferase involved in cell wall biosynthesis
MRICLNMIVKDEAAVITRCLASVKPWIDHWVIVDTGSTDGTQEIVREFMRDVPGELHERPWRNFSHNRNEALELARSHGDYVLFIDADETLRVPQGFSWPQLGDDAYRFRCEYSGWTYERNALAATRLRWRWEGVLHEYLTSDQPHRWSLLPGPVLVISHDGARGRDPETYQRDIEVLERAVRDDPGNARYMFYLAQSYRDAGRIEQAAERYRQRAGMAGWEEERWFAAFQVAVLSERLAVSPAEVSQLYLSAYQSRPNRAEPLCELARYHRTRGEFALAHLYARQAAAIPYPSDSLFVDAAVYGWRALDEVAVAAFYVEGARAEGRAALEKLWSEGRFPETERARMSVNRDFYGMNGDPSPHAAANPAGAVAATGRN